MTELLREDITTVAGADGAPLMIVCRGRRRRVARVAVSWMVETGWWRTPVRRHYHRCLLEDGECLEIYRDLDTGRWRAERRYD